MLTPELQAQVDLDSINFVSNDRLQAVLADTTATPAQVAEAVRVNTEARLRALKIGLLDHGRPRAAVDHPGRPAAELPAGRDPGGPAAVAKLARQVIVNATIRRIK